MSVSAVRTLLGGHAPRTFLERFWQKEALLVRAALAGFAGLFTLPQLIALACRDDVEARLVTRSRGRWTLAHGPFRRADFRGLPPRDWTLLVQGANLASADADALLRRFHFLPYARLDDLMVSYAAPGGGVGPHFDSYDVFLLQGSGRRRWRYGRQDDLSLVPGLPLKILQKFAPQHDEVLGPGDMLYLPPQYAHDGIAVDACTTYSIGFRAASHEELAQHFLDFLRDELDVPGRYEDPDLRATREPARIDAAMQRKVADALARIRWNSRTAARFLGTYLSEPKQSVRFERPEPARSAAGFARTIARNGVALDRGTQILYDSHALYVNGETLAWPAGGAVLKTLANRRVLSAQDCRRLPAAMRALLHDWYLHGFVTIAR